MAVITPVRVPSTGVAPSANAAANADTINNSDGRTCIRATNASGSAITATLTPNAVFLNRPADGSYPAQTTATKVVSIPAGTTQIFGPIEKVYNDPTTGMFSIAWSATASVTYEAYQIP